MVVLWSWYGYTETANYESIAIAFIIQLIAINAHIYVCTEENQLQVSVKSWQTSTPKKLSVLLPLPPKQVDPTSLFYVRYYVRSLADLAKHFWPVYNTKKN